MCNSLTQIKTKANEEAAPLHFDGKDAMMNTDWTSSEEEFDIGSNVEAGDPVETGMDSTYSQVPALF